jgi:IS30 family transposase
VIDMTERDDAIIRLTRAGESAPAIAARLGICERTVQRVRVRAGISPPPVSRFTPDEIRLAESLLADGASYGEVARTLGRHQTVVRNKFPNHSAWASSSGVELARMFAALEAVS